MIFNLDDIKGDVKRAADVVIIGSGAGGAPLAKELSGEGYSVILVEEGAKFDREKDFNLNPTQSFMRMYRDAGQTLTLGVPFVLLPLGKTLGGTTTINSGTALRMLRPLLKKWHTFHGLSDITEDMRYEGACRVHSSPHRNRKELLWKSLVADKRGHLDKRKIRQKRDSSVGNRVVLFYP